MKTTFELLKSVVDKNPDIKEFTIAEFGRQSDVINEHDWDEHAKSMFDFALKVRSKFSLPFWECLMLSSINNPDFSGDCLSSAMRHNTLIHKRRIQKGNVDTIQCIVDHNKSTAINSEVVCLDGVKYIPMMDFHISKSDTNLQVVSTVLRAIGANGGYILDSGNSYHYIGDVLFTQSEQLQFLAKALLFAPIVDSTWIAHQIMEGTCSLRLGLKHGDYPRLVKTL